MAWYFRSTLHQVNNWAFQYVLYSSVCSCMEKQLLLAEMDPKKIHECSGLPPSVVFCGVLSEVQEKMKRDNQRQLKLPKEYCKLVKTALLSQTTFLGNKQKWKIRPMVRENWTWLPCTKITLRRPYKYPQDPSEWISHFRISYLN